MINIHIPLGFTLSLFRVGQSFPPGRLANTWNILEIGVIYNDLQQNSLVFSSLLHWCFVRIVKRAKWKSGVTWWTGIHAGHYYSVGCKRKSATLVRQSYRTHGQKHHVVHIPTILRWNALFLFFLEGYDRMLNASYVTESIYLLNCIKTLVRVTGISDGI